MSASTLITTVLATALAFGAPSIAHESSDHSTGSYTLTDDLTYKNFFDGFTFFHDTDPTKGFVQYQNLAPAIEQGLVGYLEDSQSVFMGVDYTNKDPKGRASVRLESRKAWNHGLLIADIIHMPSSECGVWPAYWLLGSEGDNFVDDDKYGKPIKPAVFDWPTSGELDILEGVNDYQNNAVTLHTSAGCAIDNSTTSTGDTSSHPYTGILATADCDIEAPNQEKNAGCSIKAPPTLSSAQMGTGDSTKQADLASYGTAFNAAGGGVYASEWTDTSISVWFIPRSSPLYSTYFSSNSTASASADPSKWGTPLAHFSGATCDFKQRFRNLRVIFNTTFCGEWAGKVWDKSCKKKTGAETCEDYVRENPGAFKEAFWEIKGLRWFEKGEVQMARNRKSEEGGYVKVRGRFKRI